MVQQMTDPSHLIDASSFSVFVQANGSLGLDDMLPCGTTVGVFVLRHVITFAKKSRNLYDYKPPRNLLQEGS